MNQVDVHATQLRKKRFQKTHLQSHITANEKIKEITK